MQAKLIGWDIGGAHVKAALMNNEGELFSVYQEPCPLWRGLDELPRAVNAIMAKIARSKTVHVITMTGEMVDLFDNRDDGVMRIVQTMTDLFAGTRILFFAGKNGFLEGDKVTAKHYQSIASANWMASASLAAIMQSDGLFVDCGSTTTDILILSNGQVLAEGYTDYQRLLSHELVYTGVIRTAVMAVAQTVMDQGKQISLIAEHFATMADVYRVTGELNEAHDQTETADGGKKTALASARRLSRMIGCDFHTNETPRWQQLAANLRVQQLRQIQRGCEARLSKHQLAKDSPVIGAGVGRFLVKQIALNLNRPYVDFTDLLPFAALETDLTSADCAPAVAIAYLADKYCKGDNTASLFN